jgi:hypothetical protein
VDGGGAAQPSDEQKLISGGGDAIWMAWDQELITGGRAALLNTGGATTRGIQLAAMDLAGGGGLASCDESRGRAGGRGSRPAEIWLARPEV